MVVQPPLQIVSPDATPEEVAAITAAVTAVLAERQAAARAAGVNASGERSEWVRGVAVAGAPHRPDARPMAAFGPHRTRSRA